MNNRHNVSGQDPPLENPGQALRQRAEEIVREKEDCSSNEMQVSPEETRQKLHELLVHQIELEMQNDELRRAQTELEEARARYADLYDFAPMGYCTISEKGMILGINLTAANLLCVARSALINKPISKFIFKEDQDVYYLHKLELFKTGAPQACELRMKKSDGTVFWARLDAITLQDKNDVRIGRVVLSDITERRQIELKVQLKNTILQIINHIYEASVSCKTLEAFGYACLDIIESATKSKLSFIGEIEQDGVLHDIAVHMAELKGLPENLPIHELFSTVILNGENLITNDPSHHPDGIGILEGYPKLDSFLGVPFILGGKAVGMVAVANRVGGYTEEDQEMLEALTPTVMEVILRKRAEEALHQSEQRALTLVEELQRADRSKNEFISTLSHEIRNPLAVIMAGISLLELTDDTEKVKSAKEVMKRQSAQLCRLVDDLLDLTRITMNKILLKKERIELNKLVATVADDYNIQFEKKGVRLETNMTADSLFMEADSARLTQIIGNLMHNAVKFTETGGTTQLTVSKQKGQAVICVKDNGIGINPEILPDIFEPFVQLDNSIERSNGGLGLGLAIVKGMVELHGGRVSAFSEGPAKGAQFTVLLPLSSEENEQEEKNPCGRLSRSYRILFIEDNIDLADVFCTMLGQLGHKAIWVSNGIDGIAKAKEFLPQVIFCDIGLPGMSGYEVARNIRTEDSLVGIFMVALTGYAGQRDIELAVNSGFNKHISKPVDIDALHQILAEVP